MFFKDDLYFLSNMFPCNVTISIGGVARTFSCVESAFQACKNFNRATEFIGLDGYEARRLGRQVDLRKDWFDVKIQIMWLIVKAKFDQNPELIDKLIEVQGDIVEENTWGDTCWGICNGVGANILGKILMRLRDEYFKLKKLKTVCFTGRRPKDLLSYDNRYKKEYYQSLVDYLKETFRKLYEEEGYTRFISGGAQGFDQLVFWAVNALKRDGLPLKNIVYVPFQGYESRWQDTGLFSKSDFNLMLSCADEVKILVDHIPSNIPVTLHERNHAMVNDSDLVIGLYPDDSWRTAKKGGTAECLKYSSKKGKEIAQIKYKIQNDVFTDLEFVKL